MIKKYNTYIKEALDLNGFDVKEYLKKVDDDKKEAEKLYDQRRKELVDGLLDKKITVEATKNNGQKKQIFQFKIKTKYFRGEPCVKQDLYISENIIGPPAPSHLLYRPPNEKNTYYTIYKILSVVEPKRIYNAADPYGEENWYDDEHENI